MASLNIDGYNLPQAQKGLWINPKHIAAIKEHEALWQGDHDRVTIWVHGVPDAFEVRGTLKEVMAMLSGKDRQS